MKFRTQKNEYAVRAGLTVAAAAAFLALAGPLERNQVLSDNARHLRPQRFNLFRRIGPAIYGNIRGASNH